MDNWQSGKFILSEINVIHILNQIDIIRCHSNNCYCTIFMTDGHTYCIPTSLTKLKKKLSNSFMKVSRSHLINLEHVLSVDKRNKKIVMTDKEQVSFTTTLKEIMQNFTNPDLLFLKTQE